jgi:hypothetical protein
VINNGLDWARFPLLARPAQVESAMNNDSSYNCTLSYDGGGGKSGKKTPTGGCCGSVVSVKTGIGSAGASAAHLEPDVSCVIPQY